MRNIASCAVGIKATVLTVMFLVLAGETTISYGQQKRKPAATNHVSDTYLTSQDSRFKPELRYLLVRLKGDNGVSIIDLDGNIISRNFAPVTNSRGKITGESRTTPVIDDIFCIERCKRINGEWQNSLSVYHNASNPTPI